MKKNKIITATIAASLVLGSVAGLPLSAKGLLSHLGGVASAQALQNQDALLKLTQIYAELSPEEKAAIATARTNLKAIDADHEWELVYPVWHKIYLKDNNAGIYHTHILNLIKDFAIFYDPTFEDLQTAIAKPENRELLAKIATVAGGFSSTENDFTTQDAIDFVTAIVDALETEFDVTNAALYLADHAAAKDLLEGALENVITTQKDNLKFAKLIYNLGITASDLMEVYTRINNKVDTVDNAAQKAFISGVIKSQTEIIAESTSSWKEKTLKLEVLDEAISSQFAGLISYSPSGTDASKVHISGGKLILNDNIDATTEINISLTASVVGKVFKTQALSTTFTKPSSSDPVVVTPPADVKGPETTKALEQIAANIEKIADLAKNPNAGNGLKKAQEAIQEAIREAAKVDVSSTVKVENGVAKPNLDSKKIADAFKAVKEIAKGANDKLKEAVPEAKPAKVIATLNLGTVTAGTTQIPLAADILTAAKENGIDAIALVVNGISLAIDVDQLAGATTVTIKKEEKSVATSATQLNVASDVYEFNFESEGKHIDSFSKPVEVKIPLASVPTGVNSDLLVLTKIQDGKLIFKGGQYDATKKEFAALNKSFSTYAVVENKVSFKDTASVDSWAGHQIAVVAAKGIVEGRAAGEFVPEGKVTRAEFAKMIVKAYGLEDAAATESFADVSDNDWFKPYVAAAVKAGLINGRSAASFEPNAEITRAEMATIAARALINVKEYKTVVTEEALKAFADAASINTTLTAGVALATEQGIVVGDESKQFNPNNSSTRAQAAVVIYRLLNK